MADAPAVEPTEAPPAAAESAAVAPAATAEVAPVAAPSAQVMMDPASSGALNGMTGMLVRQDMFLLEAFTCLDKRNTYKIAARDPSFPEVWDDAAFKNSPMAFNIKEEATCFQRYSCLRPFREIKMHVSTGEQSYDKGGQEVFTIHRPMKFPIIFCFKEFCAPEASLYNAPQGSLEQPCNEQQRVGTVKHDFRCVSQMCGKDYWLVQGANGETKYQIESNMCCNANMFAPSFCCKVRTFEIQTPDGQTVGSLEDHFNCNIKRLCLSSADQYVLKFPAGASAEDKALLLTATMLLEFSVMEKPEEQQ
jgi:hypothetical protein